MRPAQLFTVAIPARHPLRPGGRPQAPPVLPAPGQRRSYEGINLRWPNISGRRNGALGDRMVKTDYNDFAPRLGITWSATPKLVIRAGAGIFYSQDTGNPRFDMARNLAGRTRFESIGNHAVYHSRPHSPGSPAPRRSCRRRTRSPTSTTGRRRGR